MKKFFKEYGILLIAMILINVLYIVSVGIFNYTPETIFDNWIPSKLPLVSFFKHILEFAVVSVVVIALLLLYLVFIGVILALIYKKEKDEEKQILWAIYINPILMSLFVLAHFCLTLFGKNSYSLALLFALLYIPFVWHPITALIASLIIPKKYLSKKWLICKNLLSAVGICILLLFVSIIVFAVLDFCIKQFTIQ